MEMLHIGPAGWSYEDWKGRVYPEPAPRGFDPLAYLAAYFRCIEVNSSFYRPPGARMAEAWVRRTPEGFLFTLKAWERFTHDREGFTEADVRMFRDGLSPLRESGKLGGLLLQYPWFFRDGASSRDRLKRAADALRGEAPLIVELRHRSWLQAFDFLKENGLGFCNIDQPVSASALTGTSHLLGRVGYVRLHGRNAKAWFDPKAGRDAKYDYLYSPEELQEWAERIRRMGEADRLFVITNNHFQGKAVANALQLARALGMAVRIPDPLVQAFPGLF